MSLYFIPIVRGRIVACRNNNTRLVLPHRPKEIIGVLTKPLARYTLIPCAIKLCCCFGKQLTCKAAVVTNHYRGGREVLSSHLEVASVTRHIINGKI